MMSSPAPTDPNTEERPGAVSRGDPTTADGTPLSAFENEALEDRIWNAQEIFILHDSVSGYRKSPRPKKKQFVQSTVRKIKVLFEEKVGEANIKPGGSHYDAWQIKKRASPFSTPRSGPLAHQPPGRGPRPVIDCSH